MQKNALILRIITKFFLLIDIDIITVRVVKNENSYQAHEVAPHDNNLKFLYKKRK